ncbi:hypothetical protein ABIA52_001024 [Paenarthrobacter histidinolovorans]|uniref:Uncharacterized protein n=1 Tax=Paenarthrobacter histidinolovorans TaxID=43664 RepID=A0ABW8N4D6_9MICC
MGTATHRGRMGPQPGEDTPGILATASSAAAIGRDGVAGVVQPLSRKTTTAAAAPFRRVLVIRRVHILVVVAQCVDHASKDY